MATNNGIITAPVTVKEVADLLNSSGSGASAKYDVGSVCTSGRINMWAKYKPVKYNTLQATGKRSGLEYWKANDGSCGVSMGNYIYTSAQAFVNAIFNNGVVVKWEHVKPTGGPTFPYRLTDFEGYYHNAIQPFGDISDDMKVYINYVNGDYVAQVDLDCTVSDEDDYNLLLSDFSLNGKNFSDCYLAIAIKTSAKGWIVATSEKKMGTGDLSVLFSDVYSLGNSSGKTYDCIVCVATEQYNSITGEEPSNIKYIGIPVVKKKITFINQNNTPSSGGQDTEGGGGDNAPVYIYVYGEFTNSEKTEMRWWYECYNNSSSAKTLRFNCVLGNDGVNNGSSMNTGALEVSLAAGKSITSETFTKSGLVSGKNYWTWATRVDGTDAFGWVAYPVEEGFAPED